MTNGRQLSPDHGRPGVTSKKGVIRGFGGTEGPARDERKSPAELKQPAADLAA